MEHCPICFPASILSINWTILHYRLHIWLVWNVFFKATYLSLGWRKRQEISGWSWKQIEHTIASWLVQSFCFRDTTTWWEWIIHQIWNTLQYVFYHLSWVSNGLFCITNCRFDWSERRFLKSLPKSYWNKETGRKFLDDLGTKLNIRSSHDWYRVTVSEILHHGGSGLYTKYGTLFKMFSSIYPEYLMYHFALQFAYTTGLKSFFMECHSLEDQ